MTRRQAGVFLRREYGRRFPFVDPLHISLNKHLARLVWPQSSLFADKGYFRPQLEAYVAARWPLAGDDPIIEKARFLCMAYGEV
jgi:hypothetical protein